MYFLSLADFVWRDVLVLWQTRLVTMSNAGELGSALLGRGVMAGAGEHGAQSRTSIQGRSREDSRDSQWRDSTSSSSRWGYQVSGAVSFADAALHSLADAAQRDKAEQRLAVLWSRLAGTIWRRGTARRACVGRPIIAAAFLTRCSSLPQRLPGWGCLHPDVYCLLL